MKTGAYAPQPGLPPPLRETSPTEASRVLTASSRREQVQVLQARALGLQAELSAASARYLRSQDTYDLLHQQQVSIELERCLHRLRRIFTP